MTPEDITRISWVSDPQISPDARRVAFVATTLSDDQDEYLKWTEPSELLMLFRGRPDRSPRNALNVIDKAWDRIGVA